MLIGRRKFLANVAAGGATLTMPAFLSGCGVNQALSVNAVTPDNPFLEWFGIDQLNIARVMAVLTANGADIAELYFQHRRRNTLGMEDGVLSHAHSEITQGVGQRVVLGDTTGYAYTEDLTLPSMLYTARKAASIAHAGPSVSPKFFNPDKIGDLYVIEAPWSEIGIDRKLRLLNRVNTQAHQFERSVSNVSVHLSDVDERVLIATLDGHLIADRRPMTRLSVEVTATKNGISQTGFSNIAAREGFSWYTDERIDTMVREAVSRTLVLFDARRPPEGEMPVILAAGTSGIVLHEAIGHSLEADFNRSGASIYSDMMGMQIAAPFVTVVDQGTIPYQRGSLNYDDEGHSCRRTAVVEEGVLRSYLHDGMSSKHYGVAVTGSGRRQSYRFAPMPRMTCTFMEAGPHAKEEIIAATENGILAETFTSGQVTIGAGDFSFYVKNGWLVENGTVTAPIKDVKITGNGPEMLQGITMVANDARFATGGWTCGKNGQSVPVSQGMPTVRVSRLGVSGVKIAES